MGGTQIPDLNWYFNGKIIESSDGFWIIPANSDDLIIEGLRQGTFSFVVLLRSSVCLKDPH